MIRDLTAFPFNGVNIALFTKKILCQYRFPKSKKARIRNKWKRDPENYKEKWAPSFMGRHNYIFLNPDDFKILKVKIDSGEIKANEYQWNKTHISF